MAGTGAQERTAPAKLALYERILARYAVALESSRSRSSGPCVVRQTEDIDTYSYVYIYMSVCLCVYHSMYRKNMFAVHMSYIYIYIYIFISTCIHIHIHTYLCA